MVDDEEGEEEDVDVDAAMATWLQLPRVPKRFYGGSTSYSRHQGFDKVSIRALVGFRGVGVRPLAQYQQ